MLEYSKVYAQQIAQKYPLLKKCELCPDPKEIPTHRHHPDYCYPHIFVSLCYECHLWVHKDLSRSTKRKIVDSQKTLPCASFGSCPLPEYKRNCETCYFSM
jgi:hypothetical protein